MRKTNLFILISMLLFMGCQNLFGAFINGVEGFDGTVKDMSTWEEYLPYGGAIYQDDKLICDLSLTRRLEYTTKTVTVGVGDIVRVELLEHPQGNAESTMFLTTNSEGTNKSTSFDSHYLFIEYVHWPSSDEYWFVGGSGVSGASIGQIFGIVSTLPSTDNPYILEIERTTSNSAVFRAYDSDMTLIGSLTRTSFIFPGVPDDLYISLSAWGKNGGFSIFDNVTIIPEPGMILLLGLGGLLLRRRR